MQIYDASLLARELMDQHELGHWIFEFDNAKRRRGLCTHTTRTISLSGPLTKVRDEASVRNTILHEIAHALVGPGHGHDATWKKVAKGVGCDGERCANDGARVEGKWTGVCPHCPTTFTFHKRPKRVKFCLRCWKALGKHRVEAIRIHLTASLKAATAENEGRNTL